MLSKLSVPGRPANLVRVEPFMLEVGAGTGCLDIFSLIYLLFLLSPSLSGRLPDTD